MMILKLLSAFIFPTLLGYLLVELIASKEDTFKPFEKLAISYGAGIGLLTFIMFLIGAFKIPINLSSILIVCAVLFAYPFVMVARKIRVPRFSAISIDLKDIKWYEWALFSLISLRVIYSYFIAMIKPVEDVDAFASWSLKAKVFFVEQGLSLGKTHGYFLGIGHIYYPINIPLFETWIFNVLGTWNDLLIKAIFPTFLLALIVIFYYSMKRISSRAFSLFSTYLLTTLPFLIYHSATTYMDFPLTFYFFSSFIYLIIYMRSGNRSCLIISSLLAGICAWTKNEGVMLALITLLAAFVYFGYFDKNDNRIKASLSVIYAAILLFFPASWSIFKIIYGVPSPKDQVLYFSKMFEYADRIPVIIIFYFQKALFYGHWNLAWFVFILVLIFSLIKGKFSLENTFIVGAILLCMGGYGIEYYLSKSYDFLIYGMTLNRNFLTFMPLVIYYICSAIPAVIRNVPERSLNVGSDRR
jgi:hypothetical protein